MQGVGSLLAGLEDGLQLVNRFAGTFYNITTWSNYAISDGWDHTNGLTANVYHMRRFMDASETTFYDVYVTNVPGGLYDDGGPFITAIATVPWNFRYTDSPESPLVAAVPPAMFAAGGVNPGTTLTLGRSVAIQTKKDPLFTVAMASPRTCSGLA